MVEESHCIQGKLDIFLLDFLENLYGNIITAWKTGATEKEIFRVLGLKEDYFTKCFCFGNVSMLNGVRSAIRHYEKNQSRP